MNLVLEKLDILQQVMNSWIWGAGPTINGETVPLMVLLLLGTGLFTTLYLGFIQVRWLWHSFQVVSGKFDDPEHDGDINHFQALSTALSATVGIGNIAGVAIAIHYGGPGALFWMWLTALFGMALKYAECTLALQYRDFDTKGNVSGGPMYYIEKGLGPSFKWLAILFAICAVISSFGTGNAIQAFTVADSLRADFMIPQWLTGLVVSTLVGIVIIGGIRRIGAVTSFLAPFMAAVYCFSASVILLMQFDKIPGALKLIVQSAMDPASGAVGVAGGSFMVTLLWGVKRGLFSNEAGQGSAPIAHAAAKTDEPVREGVVALLGPFIDTLVICSMTGLVIITSGVWQEHVPTRIPLNDAAVSWVAGAEFGAKEIALPATAEYLEGKPATTGQGFMAYNHVAIEALYLDEAQSTLFTGTLDTDKKTARSLNGDVVPVLYGSAVRNGSPLTALAFTRGLEPINLGFLGVYIVAFSVFLFAISTAISWSYYGDRCVQYLFGDRYVPHYRWMYVVVNFIGALVSLEVVWGLGDAALGMMAIPNLFAILFLARQTKKITNEYAGRKKAGFPKRVKTEVSVEV